MDTMRENGGRQSFSLLNFDTQETKKKVLGGNISGNLLNLVFWAERTGTEATKRFAYAPTVVKHVVKKISEFRVVRKWWETLDFAPKMQKIKPKTIRFRLYLV